jgi:hypothetical protein
MDLNTPFAEFEPSVLPFTRVLSTPTSAPSDGGEEGVLEERLEGVSEVPSVAGVLVPDLIAAYADGDALVYLCEARSWPENPDHVGAWQYETGKAMVGRKQWL